MHLVIDFIYDFLFLACNKKFIIAKWSWNDME